VGRALLAGLTEHRLTLIPAEETQAGLAKIVSQRATSSDRLVALRVGQALKADVVLYGSITEAALPSAEGVGQPTLGLSFRMVDIQSGTVVLSAAYSLSGPLRDGQFTPLAEDATAALVGILP
jgi:hypothetical protein